MGGKGSRFSEQGYKLNKTLIPVTSRHDGKKYPMALSAILDMPWVNFKSTKIICVNSSEHAVNGLEKKIFKAFPQTIFIHDHIKLDQAFGCFLAREFLQTNEELFIGACDNGFDIDIKAFTKLKKSADAIMLSHNNDRSRNHWNVLVQECKYFFKLFGRNDLGQ